MQLSSAGQLLAAGTDGDVVARHRRDLAALREKGFLLDVDNIEEAAAEEMMPLSSNISRDVSEHRRDSAALRGKGFLPDVANTDEAAAAEEVHAA